MDPPSSPASQYSPEHVPFPSIEQFKKAVKEVKQYYKACGDVRPSTLPLRGTVKLHGTHADIVHNGGLIHFQSRNRVLSKGKDGDNCGFVRFMEDEVTIPLIQESIIQPVIDVYTKINGTHPASVGPIMIAGEFCGAGIQKGVALSKLPLMFVIFAIKIDTTFQDMEQYKDIHLEEKSIYNIFRAGTFSLDLNMDDPQASVSELKSITDRVEKECPFAKTFGVSGTGEGVVWAFNHPSLICRSRFYFKVKGEEHAGSRVVTLKEKSPEEIAALRDAREFARKALTDSRLRQGLDYLKEMNLDSSLMQNISAYIKWVIDDVDKEEKEEMIQANVDQSKLRSELSKIAVGFYKSNLSS